jgi:hypothetical protein
MNEHEDETQSEDKPSDSGRSSAQSTPPRGNPERDQESIEKGEEQLGKIAGN